MITGVSSVNYSVCFHSTGGAIAVALCCIVVVITGVLIIAYLARWLYR